MIALVARLVILSSLLAGCGVLQNGNFACASQFGTNSGGPGPSFAPHVNGQGYKVCD